MKSLANDERYFNAKIGFISLLHTFGLNISFHPHIHMIILGGGLEELYNLKKFTILLKKEKME